MYVTWLDHHASTEAARVGGKAASLARLGAAGFPVPPGFALTVEAYRHFHAAHDLEPLVEPLEGLGRRPMMPAVREAAAPLLAAVETATIPGEVAAALAAAVAELEARAPGHATFAVRSSGVSEDGAKASFAGLYESYLNLRGAAAITQAVLDCYRCLWQPRAIQYRSLKGVGHRGEAMATVVMQTVSSHVSGVAFTLNPVTGAQDEVVINASWGLGESIVSGLVTPDSFTTAKDGSLRAAVVSEKAQMVTTVPGGTSRQEVPRHLVNAPALDEARVAQVAQTAVAVEALYGSPVDIEFAYDAEGRFYLLQARPVTTR
ncbi:MAG: PEP/pyruvate-binding domain-containing protein [Dehalococcoidia bacterium]